MRATATIDAYGNSVKASFRVSVVDRTPPELTVPGAIVGNATSPAGAVVTFAVTAVDRVTAQPVVACSPASGTTFPIGDSTVTCTATDAAGNAGQASFPVHVKSAAEQIGDLRAYVDALAAKDTKLAAAVADVQKNLADDKLNAVCGGLADVADRAQKLAGKELTAEESSRIVADATRIRSVLAC